MDFNHPLAGEDLHFVGEIVTVRPATPEELHPSCGGCGGGCNCGDEHHNDCGGRVLSLRYYSRFIEKKEL